MKKENTVHHFKDGLLQWFTVLFHFRKKVFYSQKAFCITLIVSFFTVTAINFFIALDRGGLNYLNIEDFAIGKVAERDVVVSRDISYTDQIATDIRRTARLRTVIPIFRQDADITSDILKKYDEFIAFLLGILSSEDRGDIASQIQAQYPEVFEPYMIQALLKVQNLEVLLAHAHMIVKQSMAIGIAEFPEKGLEAFNQTEIMLSVKQGNNREYMNVQIGSLIREENIAPYIKTVARALGGSFDPDIMIALIRPFIHATIFYEPQETEMRVREIMKQVPPVIVTIQKNQKIIKRGFIITAENHRQLQAYAEAGSHIDISKFSALTVFILFLYIAGLFTFFGQSAFEQMKESQKIFMLLILVTLYLVVLFAGRFAFFVLPLDMLPFIPAALTTMLVVTLVSQKMAVLTVFFIMLLVLTATGFKFEPALFAFFSGLSAVSLIKLTGKRMDLIKTAYQLAFIHPIIAGILMWTFPHSYSSVAFVCTGSVVNGFMSGIFVLGFLPILEDRMNTPTCFRLMELSDLNSQMMKNMLVSASGTYNHTMMVATLAEAGCRAIGANALLARVGAYYHDIGKMQSSEYFVENQTSYNKHLDLNPRLSATIIRSHVKIGVEKAESMRLPKEVIDIIREHHGNSLVYYFYAKAKELDPNVDPADFSYPGQPPRSKESAVVMLADVTEAACRTLDRPSVPRLEKFIGKLFRGKMEAAQLDNSELTLRELKIIQECFVNTLAGSYHSRIKYPNQKDPDEKQSDEKPSQQSQDSVSPEVKNYIQVDLGLAAPLHQSVKEEHGNE